MGSSERRRAENLKWRVLACMMHALINNTSVSVHIVGNLFYLFSNIQRVIDNALQCSPHSAVSLIHSLSLFQFFIRLFPLFCPFTGSKQQSMKIQTGVCQNPITSNPMQVLFRVREIKNWNTRCNLKQQMCIIFSFIPCISCICWTKNEHAITGSLNERKM